MAWPLPRYAMRAALIGAAFAALSANAYGQGVYQSPEAFIDEIFGNHPPLPQVLWLTGEHKQKAEEILDHPYPKLRIRYWLKDGRSAWILEEIGKEQPITTGLVVGERGLEKVKVLIFRESRGWEVRHPFFTDQFTSARLNQALQLDRPIDNISGATLSVNAIQKLARLALYLHQAVITP